MVEKAHYIVVKKIDDIEVRDYPELILAIVEDFDDDRAFGLLYNYISGENKSRKKISMTAPVISSEKIPMTAPVISQKNFMAFVMPSTYDKSTIPEPKNRRVKIRIQPKKTLAIQRFSGYATSKKTELKIKQLLSTLEKNNFKTKGEPFLMRYNSPFAPGFIRRNEVAIEIN